MKNLTYIEIALLILAVIAGIYVCIMLIRSPDGRKEQEPSCRDRLQDTSDPHFSLSLNAAAPPEEVVIRYSHSRPKIHTNRVSGSFLRRIKRFFACAGLITAIFRSLPRLIGVILHYIRQFLKI